MAGVSVGGGIGDGAGVGGGVRFGIGIGFGVRVGANHPSTPDDATGYDRLRLEAS